MQSTVEFMLHWSSCAGRPFSKLFFLAAIKTLKLRTNKLYLHAGSAACALIISQATAPYARPGQRPCMHIDRTISSQ